MVCGGKEGLKGSSGANSDLPVGAMVPHGMCGCTMLCLVPLEGLPYSDSLFPWRHSCSCYLGTWPGG